MQYLFSLILILFFSTYGWSATYFIDYTNSEGTSANTENGTSTATAWIHSPGDPRASDNADITLSAGDTVVFKGGITYAFASGDGDSQILANASGSSGSIITYISGHVYATPWGSGRAVIDGEYSNLSSGDGVLDLGSYSYITVEGFEFVYQPTESDVSIGMILWSGSTGGNIIIDNCYLHYTNAAAIIITGDYDGSTTPSGFTIKNSTIENSHAHLLTFRWELDDIDILDNTFDLAGNDPYSTGGPVANCINFSYDSPTGPATQTNITMRGNTFSDTAVSKNKGLILIQESIDIFLIEDNTFNCTVDTGCVNFSSPVDNMIIRNNVFHGGPLTNEGILRFRTAQGTVRSVTYDNIDILNNTFVTNVDAGGNAGIIYFHKGDETNDIMFTNVDIRNNIFDTDDGTDNFCIFIIQNNAGNGPVVQLSTLTCDYNAYQNLNSSSDYFYYRTVGRTFAEWKSDISDDANSNFGQVAFNNEAGDDFILDPSDTIAKDEGVTLTEFSDDKDGISRPQGPTWDIGAYEYQSPTLSTATIASNGTTLTLVFSEAITQGSGYHDADIDLDAAVTGNNISVTYSSGDGTTTHIYTASSTLVSGESVNLDFNGDADSWENSESNDVAAIVSKDCVNNSTQGQTGITEIATGVNVTLGTGSNTNLVQ